MSLYIGNLSSRSRRVELERVFRRFGRCNVQLKDGYGFVVYDFPANAEKALKALQGRSICGEPLTLTWSNKQPRPFKRFARGARSYEPICGRNAARGGDYVNRKLVSNAWQDYKVRNGGRFSSIDKLDEETSCHRDDIKDHTREDHHDYKEDLPDEVGGVEPIQVDGDRWNDQFHNPENGAEFDRYEPNQGYDKKDDDENHQVVYSGGSPAPPSSQEKIGRGHSVDLSMRCLNDSNFQQTCYNCGGSGHKMRNCPKERTSRRKFTRFDCRHDDGINRRGRIESKLERFGSRSLEKLQSGRETTLMRRQRNDKKTSDPGKDRKLVRSGKSPLAKDNDGARRRRYGRKKRNRTEIGSAKSRNKKKTRRSVSSPLHSDYSASRSHSSSQSSKPVIRSHSHSRSRSVSSRPHSLDSDSRSSRSSRSKSSKYRSRSSSPTSLSLSVSLSHPLPSSSNKVQLNVKGSLDNATTPESKEILVEREQFIEGEAWGNAELGNKVVAVNNENTASFSKVENEMEKDPALREDNFDGQMVSGLLYEVTNPSTPLTEKGAGTAGASSPEGWREIKEHESSDALMVEFMPEVARKPDSETPASCCDICPSISSEDLYRVLRHYGLKLPEENEKCLSAEDYFGSARIWPWEVVYYRRLKKGPISMENYARRAAQNREFGIVDKYVRSSSGWGEIVQNNF